MKKKWIIVYLIAFVITCILMYVCLYKYTSKLEKVKNTVNIVNLNKYYKENRKVTKKALDNKVLGNAELAKVKAIKMTKGLIVDGNVGYNNKKAVFIVTDKWNELTNIEKIRICKSVSDEINKIMNESIYLRFVNGCGIAVAESDVDHRNKFRIIE